MQVAALLEHPDARELPAIGRALVPLDDHAAGVLEDLGEGQGSVRLSDPARRALRARDEPQGEGSHTGATSTASAAAVESPAHDVEFRRDRRGEHWILIGGRHAPLARVLAARGGLRAAEGPAGTVGLAAVEDDAHRLAELLDQLEDADTDPRVSAWLERATTWRGNLEVDGPSDAPVFVLLGERGRLPPSLRERAASVPGGATVPLTLSSWRLIEDPSMRGSRRLRNAA